MKQQQIDRITFIHLRVAMDGVFNVHQICEKFKLSKTMASIDIRCYRELCPGNIEYDKSKKCYLKGLDFKSLPDLTPSEGVNHTHVTVRSKDKDIVKRAGRSHAEVYRAGIVALGLWSI